MSNSPEGGQPGPDETEPRDDDADDEIDWSSFSEQTVLGQALREQEVAKYEAFMKELREREARQAIDEASPDTSDGDAEHEQGA